MLAKYPPQVSSRTAAAMWGCYVHNIVNKRLKKPEFNCEDIGDAYDCGTWLPPIPACHFAGTDTVDRMRRMIVVLQPSVES